MSKETINATANALNHLASHMATDQVALASASEEAVTARAKFAQEERNAESARHRSAINPGNPA